MPLEQHPHQDTDMQELQQSGVMPHAVLKPHLRGIGTDFEFDAVVADSQDDDMISKVVLGESRLTQVMSVQSCCVLVRSADGCAGVRQGITPTLPSSVLHVGSSIA